MKTVYSLLAVVFALSVASCGQLNYKKTKGGLLYKIIPSGSKDSVVKPGQWLKLNYKQTRNNDSLLQSTFGKMPVYQQVMDPQGLRYNPAEIFPLLKKGDSVITIVMVDTIVKQNPAQELPPYLKKGDRLYLYFKVLDVFDNDSTYHADVEAEKERQEQLAEMVRQRIAQQLKQAEDAEKSGEAARQRKVVEDYLAGHNLTAEKIGNGTYIHILEKGNGPKADSGKYVTVKYSGRRMANDSTFESNTYPDLQLGVGDVILGWDEGLQLFNEGGKGTLYIPAYLGYGKTPRPGPIKPNDALIFDIEIVKVSDKPGE